MARGEGIKKASDLFEKYKKILRAPQGSVITAFCEVVEDLYGWHIDKDKVSYSVGSKTISVAVSGPMKTELHLHQEEILAHIKARLGEQSSPTVII